MSSFRTLNSIEKFPLSLDLFYTGFEQNYSLSGKPFIPKIFTGYPRIPSSEFNTVSISIDFANPIYEEISAIAASITERGLYILWEFKCNLDEKDENFLDKLENSIVSFIQALWNPFKSNTLGVVLYKGSLQEEVIELCKFIDSHLPDTIASFVVLDLEAIKSPYLTFQKISVSDLEYFHLIVKSAVCSRFPFAMPIIPWNSHGGPLGFYSDHSQNVSLPSRVPISLVLPAQPIPEIESRFNDIIERLEQRNLPFRVLPEQWITTAWDGIDYFMTFPSALTSQGMRKLLGFCAAGGSVISLEQTSIFFPNQLSFDDLLLQGYIVD